MAVSAEESKKVSPAVWAPPLLIAVVVILAYANSFHGPFVFDDIDSIQNNPEIESIIPQQHSAAPTTLWGRPVLRLSFWLDYALADRSPEVYHVTNLLIHLTACLLLYGILRRLVTGSMWPAALAAAIWGVHPLNTEAVTYIVQRAESLASMFYLAAMYCVIRAAARDQHLGRWGIAAIVFAFLGIGCKEIVATIPVVAILLDAIFFAGSVRQALRRRWQIYAGLCLTWIALAIGILAGARGDVVSLHQAITPLDYAITQLGVIAHYLRLMFWPTGLVLDEGWPIAHSISQIGWSGAVVILLLIATLVILWLKPKIGFVGAWFFLILLPSSSFVPITSEIAAEHRMYLPMAGWIALIVLGGWTIARRRQTLRWIASFAGIAIVGILIFLTWQRNTQYASAEILWRDNVIQRPDNPRAHFNLGFVLEGQVTGFSDHSTDRASLLTEAEDEYQIALRLDPDYQIAQLRLAQAQTNSQEFDAAERNYDDLISKSGASAGPIHILRGKLRAQRENLTGARDDFQTAARLLPTDPESHYLLGVTLEELGDLTGAAAEYQKTVDLVPGYQDAQLRLMKLRAMRGEK